MTMHEDEVHVDAELVSRLVSDQFPALASLPIREVRSTGTVNAVYRLGPHLAARLPRVPKWSSDLINELAWLPLLARHLPLQVPRPVHTGAPSEDYPLTWAIYEWIEGSPYSDSAVDDERRAARHLAAFVTQLRGIDPAGASPAGRRPLSTLDEVTRESLATSGDVIDAVGATAMWARALETRPWSGQPVWIHSDLLRPNLLAHRGRLSAVIDWGGAGAGDPAGDVIAAWAVFGPRGRKVFRKALGVDDETWNRARGFALHQASVIIPYYRKTNPDFVTMAARTIGEIVSELSD